MKNTRNDRVATLLKSLSMSPTYLAKITKKDASTFTRILSGHSEPTRTTLMHIAEATGASLHWLLTGKGDMMETNPKNPAPAISQPTSTIENALIELKTMVQMQLAEKDKQIAGLLQVLGKVNFLKSAQKPDREAVLIDLKHSRAVLTDIAA